MIFQAIILPHITETKCFKKVLTSESITVIINETKCFIFELRWLVIKNQSSEKKDLILAFINRFFDRHGQIPSVREISGGTGISIATVHRYLLAMKESGMLSYNGRKNIETERMSKERGHSSIPVVGSVQCGIGDYEEENMPESLVGKGEFFALIAKGESMLDAGIHPGDYVIIRKQATANEGDIVVAFYDEALSNLKQLHFDGENNRYILKSCNKDKVKYADIVTETLSVQGVAVCVVHNLLQTK